MLRVTVVGRGNVATHFVKEIGQLSDISLRHCSASRDEELLRSAALDADLIIIAVSDDAIASVAQCLTNTKALVVHTSGTVASSVLSTARRGVLYPLQTLSKEKNVDFFHQVPLLITAGEENDQAFLLAFAQRLSNNVKPCTDEERRHLHLVAVYVSNFVDAMLIAGEHLSTTAEMLTMFEPLVRETVDKAFSLSPTKALTGPAKRRDNNTIAQHLQMLENFPDEKKLYQAVTDFILKQ